MGIFLKIGGFAFNVLRCINTFHSRSLYVTRQIDIAMTFITSKRVYLIHMWASDEVEVPIDSVAHVKALNLHNTHKCPK